MAEGEQDKRTLPFVKSALATKDPLIQEQALRVQLDESLGRR